jgi:hypothetical protein
VGHGIASARKTLTYLALFDAPILPRARDEIGK